MEKKNLSQKATTVVQISMKICTLEYIGTITEIMWPKLKT